MAAFYMARGNIRFVALLPRRPGLDGLLRLVEDFPEVDVVRHAAIIADLDPG